MGSINMGDDELAVPDNVAALVAATIARLAQQHQLPVLLSFDGPAGRHTRVVGGGDRFEVVTTERGPVDVSETVLDAMVATATTSGVIVLDIASVHPLDIELAALSNAAPDDEADRAND